MNFVIVTGLSGAGKTSALRALEDIDYYCVDNIPPILIPTFYDLCQQSKDSRMKNIAIVTDIRGGEVFDNLFEALDKLKSENKMYSILYLDARDDIIITRFKETRRKHPLSDNYNGETTEAVKLERELLRPVRERADYIIDSSQLSPAQLKERVTAIFLGDTVDGLTITCMSFGFKYGTPPEADLMFDVRCLPNPFYIKELKHLTGLDESVREYVMKWEQTIGFRERMTELVDYTLPLYRHEGKSQLVIAVGCTGGKHRSVALAQYLYNHLSAGQNKVCVQHRDIRKP
ncbi:MAG: RNase adapter RapZ [Acutalibacteraceae bacterium]